MTSSGLLSDKSKYKVWKFQYFPLFKIKPELIIHKWSKFDKSQIRERNFMVKKFNWSVSYNLLVELSISKIKQSWVIFKDSGSKNQTKKQEHSQSKYSIVKKKKFISTNYPWNSIFIDGNPITRINVQKLIISEKIWN